MFENSQLTQVLENLDDSQISISKIKTEKLIKLYVLIKIKKLRKFIIDLCPDGILKKEAIEQLETCTKNLRELIISSNQASDIESGVLKHLNTCRAVAFKTFYYR